MEGNLVNPCRKNPDARLHLHLGLDLLDEKLVQEVLDLEALEQEPVLVLNAEMDDWLALAHGELEVAGVGIKRAGTDDNVLREDRLDDFRLAGPHAAFGPVQGQDASTSPFRPDQVVRPGCASIVLEKPQAHLV